MNKTIVLLFPLALVTSCANQETLLRNDKGETRYCYLVHSGGLERIPAGDRYNQCMNEAGAAGFRRVTP